MKKQYDVLVVGELNIDIILNKLDQFPVIGKEVLSQQIDITLGSSSAIFASNICTLGSSVVFAGKIGADHFGDHVISSLKLHGVETKYIIRSESEKTGVTIALNFDEDRAMATYPGAMKNFTKEEISDKAFNSARHLHVSSVFLQTKILTDVTALFKSAKQKGMTTSLDPQWDPSESWDLDLKDLLQYVDVFMPNTAELMALMGASDLRSALRLIEPHGKNVVVKDGSNGAYLWNGSELVHRKAFTNTDVADSIGAGDSFDAGFIHKFLKKEPLEDCLEFAALMGAINTCRHGGTTAFKDFDLVKSIAQSSFNYFLQ